MKRNSKISMLWTLSVLLGTLATQLSVAGGAADSLSVSDLYVRAVPPGQPNSAAFMTIRNDGATNHAVVGAESPASKIVELHTHVEDGGVMKMRRIEKIEVPAQGETLLKPGGLHVMLIDLNEGLKEGTSIPLTLVFEDGSKKEIQAPVRKLKMKMGTNTTNK